MTSEKIKGAKKVSEVKSKEPSKAAIVKEPTYIVTMPVKEDGKRFKVGDKYEGKNSKKLLEANAIKLNK